MNLIVAVDKNWGIGRDNKLLFYIPADLKYFKSKTIDKVVIMGRSTFLTMPNQKPLKNRKNIILTKNVNLQIEGAVVCNDFESLFDEIETHNSEDVFVIGGESIYQQLLDYCDTAYITKIQADGNAQKFFPNLDKKDDWEFVESSEQFEDNGYQFTYNTYKKIK
ncbi:MAG TPA: dihydrofolate reductase [Clostridia bacterium]|nr:dihydrofolate reductase [Clostridia bacterium]